MKMTISRMVTRTRVRGLLALLAVLLPGAASAQAAPATPPCQSPEYRQFDFWIGEWDVFNPAGQKVGQNTIRSAMNGCVLHESYDSPPAYHGESFNIWDARRGVWHQSWVDVGGLLLTVEGGLENGAMVLQGESSRPDGSPILNRITWTPNEDGTVRQHWQVSSDGGTTWTTSFDGLYRRR